MVRIPGILVLLFLLLHQPVGAAERDLFTDGECNRAHARADNPDFIFPPPAMSEPFGQCLWFHFWSIWMVVVGREGGCACVCVWGGFNARLFPRVRPPPSCI